jgi:hypothetical protein
MTCTPVAFEAEHTGAPVAAFRAPTARTAARTVVDVIQIFNATVEAAI